MPYSPETSQETQNHYESIFTPEEKAAVATFIEKLGMPVVYENFTDGYIIELCEEMSGPFDNPPFDDKIGQILTRTVEKASRAAKEMRENIIKLACKIPELTTGDNIEKFIDKYSKERSRYPLNLRAEMAAMTLKPLIGSNETIDLPNANLQEGKEAIKLIEKYIAIVNYWSKTRGLGMEFEEEHELSEQKRREFMKKVDMAHTETIMTGTMEDKELDDLFNETRQELIDRGVIRNKLEQEIQDETKLRLAIATKNHGIA
jgi:hypothetical protein